MRHHAGEPRPGPEDDPVGVAHRLDRLGGGGRVRRARGAMLRTRARGRWRPPPGRAPCHARRASAGSAPCDLGLDLQRHGGHRQHPAPRVEQPADQVEAARPGRRAGPTGRRSAGCRARGRRAGRRRGTGAAGRRARCGPTRCRRRGRPAPSAGRPAAARRTRRAAGRDEPPLSATVTTAVMSSHDQLERLQRRGQAVPAAERDDRGTAHLLAPGRGGRRTSRRRRLASRRAQRLGDGDRAVLAAGAADGEGDVAPALADVAGR